MANRRDSWQEAFTALGQALIEVLRAELAVVAEVWKRSGRELGIALGVLALAAYLALVCLPALLIFAAVVGLEAGLGWPLWGAALAVAGLVVLVIAILALVVRQRLAKRFESPVATVQHRLADHTAWWSERILNEGTTSGESDEALEDDRDRPAGEQPA